ncbi:MAG: class I SAM-dependent methyltransferase [Flavobacteriales bacterium]
MSIEDFFELFLEELKVNTSLQYYYLYHQNPEKFHFRKAYFIQRLQYIADHINKDSGRIWDCGCGFGTTGIFLALNGIKTHGTTLEHYIKEIPARLAYYSKHGDVSGFTYSYEDLFTQAPKASSYDTIIIQDTLHHLEPINEALTILNNCLTHGGRMIVVEENGSNVIQQAKLFKYRGNKRVIEIYDETLKRKILLGNENIRSLKSWEKLFSQNGFSIEQDSIHYIRYYLLKKFTSDNLYQLIDKEQDIWKKSRFRRNYFFFGLNFIALKN